MSKRRGLAIVAVVAIAAIVVWLSWTRDSELVSPETSPSLTPQQRPAPVDVRVQIPVLPTMAEGDASKDANAGEDLGLAYHCPTVGETLAVQGRLSDECVAALERQYGDLETYKPIIPFKDRLTWQEIFSEPSRRKESALEALGNEECWVPAGTIREDLVDVCAAGDLVRHALVISTCNRSRLGRSLQTYLRPGGLREDLAGLSTLRDQESYWQRHRRIEDDHYRAAFKYSMCAQVPDGVVDLAAWERLTVEGTAAEEILASRYGDHYRASVDLLLEFAARLGNEWALETYVRDENHIQALRRINPLLAILHRGRFEEWRRGGEYDANVTSLHDEASRERERIKREHDGSAGLAELEQAINQRLWERQDGLGDPYEADVRHIRLTHLYAATAVATGYGIQFNMSEHLAGLDRITQEEWDAAREGALELFRSEWWVGD